MDPGTLTLSSRRVALPDGVRPATVRCEGGVIVRVEPYAASGAGDLGDRVLMPGVVDTHVHVNDPGRAEWEGFDSATRAAAAGGVTTLVDMPLNSIPATTCVAALEAKRAAALGRCAVDVGFWGGVIPGNTGELEPLWEAGALGFKCFLVPSGVDEFPHVSEADLRAAMPVLARLGAPLLVHAELPGPIEDAIATPTDRRSYAAYLASRPCRAEVEAADLIIRLARELGTRVHLVHVAAAEVIPLLRAARADGVRITAETCPHYLYFAAEEIADGCAAFKCAPPIRAAADRDALWRALVAGDLDLIASDHSPAPAALKDGDLFASWGGIASLQLALAATWSAGRRRGVRLDQLARWTSAAPAALAGLGRKGAIAAGRDADLVVWDPEATWVVDAGRLQHRHPVTPYADATLSGVVHATYVRGTPVYEAERFPARPAGTLLTRGAL